MVFQSLLTLYALVSVPVVALSPSPTRVPRSPLNPVQFEVFPSRVTSSEAKYPGVVVIATEATRDRAFLVSSRLSESGVTTILYFQDPDYDYMSRMLFAEHALDSLRRRVDTRSEEIGIVAFGDAIDIVPELARDTTISFAVIATEKPLKDIVSKYARAKAATLVIQGIDAPPVTTPTGPKTSTLTQGVSTSINDPIVTPQMALNIVAPSVTVWPVPKSQLDGVGENRSSLASRILGWIREQVHAGGGPIAQQQTPMTIR